jgi:hypothetical protein
MPHVTRVGERASAQALDLAGGCLAGVEFAARHDHICAVFAERLRDLQPETAASASDESRLTAEVEQVGHAQAPPCSMGGFFCIGLLSCDVPESIGGIQ